MTRPATAGGWWARRSMRTRIVVSAAVPLGVALVIGTVAVAAVFSAGRVHDLDTQTRVESDALAALVRNGQLPTTLPVPAGSTLLAQVLDPDGQVLASTQSASRVQSLTSDAAPADGVRTDERGSYAGVPLRIRLTPVTVDGRTVRVVVAAPLGDVRRALQALRLVLLLVVPLLVLGATAIVWAITGLVLRPVERLRTAAEVQATDPASASVTALPVPPGDDEIARLGRTLNDLLDALRRLVAQQRAFVADAAHELRSPVASLRVQLEVAQAHPDLVDLPVLLGGLLQDTERLGGLADDLLLLARTERRGERRRQPVDLRQIASATGQSAVVLGDDELLHRLVDNLLSNARRHASTVQITTSVERGRAVLDVDDDGPGIASADRERVFDRWVRLDISRSRPGGGAGLGLALVREIARAHGGDVAVCDSPLGGARLRVTLPLAEPPARDGRRRSVRA